MSILTKHMAVVNDHIAIQNRLAKRYENDVRRSSLHIASRDNFIALLEAMVEADAALSAAQERAARPSSQEPTLTLRPDELEDLPQELLNELSDGAVPDKADIALFQVIEERGGIASLDQILVGLYRKTGELTKRTTLTSKIYRLTQKGQLFSVPNKKGAYSTRKLTEDEASSLFGEQEQEQIQQTLA